MNTKTQIKSHSMSSSQLRKILFSYLAVGTLILALVLSGSIILPLYSRLKSADNNNIQHAVETRAMAISEWARRAKSLAWQITSRTRIRQELKKHNDGTISLEQVQSFTEPKLTDAMNLSQEILGIVRLDAKEKLIAKCGLNIPKKNWPLADAAFKNITVSHPTIISDNFVFVVRAPILNRDGSFEGSDLVVIDLSGLKVITSNYSGLGKTSQIILGCLYHNEMHSVFPLKNHDMIDDKGQILNPIVVALLKKGISENRGFDHIDNKVFAYTSIKDFSWVLLISQDESELYADLDRKLIIIGLLSVVIYLIFLFGFWLTMNPLSGRLIMHTGELEAKIKEKTQYLNDEILIRQKTEENLEKTVKDLREALDEVKTLSGLLPICSHCKKIRDDKGYWNQLEGYIQTHSEAKFSHGICTECSDELYGNEDWYIEMKNKK